MPDTALQLETQVPRNQMGACLRHEHQEQGRDEASSMMGLSRVGAFREGFLDGVEDLV